MERQLRLFIALELSAQIHQTLSELIDTLKPFANSNVKWVDPVQIHLTLKFLGDTPVARVPQIKQNLESIGQRQASFVLEAGKTGVFPNLNRPRVLWVGVSNPPELFHLQQSIDESLIPLGFQKENRQFSAHLTLGRVNDQADVESVKTIVKKLQFYALESFGSVKISKFTLFQSTLTPNGPIYTPLARFQMQK